MLFVSEGFKRLGRFVERAVSRVAKRKSGAREEYVFGWDARGVVGEMSRVGEGSFGRGAWVEWKVQRDKKRGILGGPVCSGEGSSTANRVGQQMASRYREHVRSRNARVSYVTMLQKFELSRQTRVAAVVLQKR